MYVMIVGGGRTGTQLAHLLLQQNHEIRLVEHRHEILMRLHRELPTEVIFEGEEKDGFMKVETGKGTGWVKAIMMRKQ